MADTTKETYSIKTRIFYILKQYKQVINILFLDIWYLHGNEFLNSDNLRLSKDGPLHHITNTNNGKVLGINNSKVIEEDFVEGKLGQLWDKLRHPRIEDWFFLRNAESSMFLYPTSEKKLELKGSILLKSIYSEKVTKGPDNLVLIPFGLSSLQ